ncbi:hypothetical protein EHS25_008927 [Saitozyma podzolica]|uniref:Uncharacterized protein n=1 Tax=Saitozyma podzolica TaxID=1890683 RepID=A0A427YN84_9TREE|nr:hypothetical protein EHS25_008927 [Saitozyma podzolica]
MTRVIAVIGSSQGIGLELSADANTTVHAGDRYLSEQLLGLQATRPNVHAYLADVTEPPALSTMASTIPHVDLLLMVAGVIGPRSPLLERPTTDDPVASDLLRVFSVNVIGSWNVVDAFQAKMGKGGKIMLMTSSFASMERTTHAQAPSYSIAKASLRHWTPGWDPS